MTNVLRTAYVDVAPNTDGFDVALKEQLRRKDPGGKAGKLVGSQLNAALRRVDVSTIDIKADPKQALLAIAATEDRLKALARDSATVEVKVQTEKALLELRRFKKQLGDVGDVDAGGNFVKKFTASLGTSFASAGSSAPLLVGAGVLGAALAPTIGAAIGAGLAVGVGAAAILGGIALVAKDPLVTTYGKNIGQRLLAGLTAEAQVFKQPVLDSLAALDAAAQRSLPKIGKIFAQQAPQVRGLTDSVTHAGEALLDSFVVASGRSAPALGALGHMVEALGSSVGGFITDVTANSAAGASALDDLTDAMTSTIQVTGMFIHGLADIKGALDGMDHGIDSARYAFENFLTKMDSGHTQFDITADGYKHGSEAADLYSKGVIGASGSVNDYAAYQKAATAKTAEFTGATVAAAVPLKTFGERMTDAATATKAFSDAMHKAFSDQLSLDQATLQLADGAKTLRDELTHGTRTLSLNSVEGRTNRAAVLGQLSAIESLRQARFAETGSTQIATGEYNKNIVALRRSMLQAGFSKAAVDALIGSYRKIPGKVNTVIGTPGLPQSDAGIKGYGKKLDSLARKINSNISVTGKQKAEGELKSLLIMQRALKGGISVSAASSAFNKQEAKAFGVGGFTGNVAKHAPAGVVHGREFVINADSTSKLGVNRLNYMNKTGRLPGYRAGGAVLDAPFPVNAAITRIPSRAEASAAVMPAFGNWPSSPSAQRGDSGVWRSIVALIKSTGFGGSFGNAYRPGDPLWHGSGRAVDWMGFNQDPLASFLAAKRPLELIHRTAKRDYAYTRGVNKGSFNEGLMEAHRNHVHIAMDDGGYRMLQPGMNLIPNGTGRPEPIAGPKAMAAMSGGGEVHFHFHNSVVTSERQAVDLVTKAYKTAKSERKL
jgi:hypothetical protein